MNYIRLCSNLVVLLCDNCGMRVARYTDNGTVSTLNTPVYTRLHSIKNGGIMLLNEDGDYFVCKTDGWMKFGKGYIELGTDIIADKALFSTDVGILTGDNAVMYIFKKYFSELSVEDTCRILKELV